MSLVNLQTNLKSLRFGKDTVGGGNSNQPYIVKPIPDSFAEIGRTGGYDSLVRGGYLKLSKTADDASRLLQLFADPTNFQGFSFASKMRTLSNQNVKTQANTGKNNQGNYSDVNLLKQVVASTVGDRQNVFTTDKYSDLFQPNSPSFNEQNRLLVFTKQQKNEDVDTNQNFLALGAVGQLEVDKMFSEAGYISIGDARFGNRDAKTLYSYKNGWLGTTTIRLDSSTPNLAERKYNETESYLSKIRGGLFRGLDGFNIIPSDDNSIIKQKLKPATIVLTGVTPNPAIRGERVDLDAIVANNVSENTPKKTIDFRNNANPTAPYARNAIFGDAGAAQPKTLNSKRALDAYESNAGTNLINFKYVYSNENSSKDPLYDYCDFHIAVYPNNQLTSNSRKTYIHFPAYISGLSDTFTPEWDSHKVMGRGEKFYTYTGFDRSIGLSFNVHAQSKPELLRQKQKLDYLASLMYPDYSSAGIMQGTFVELTIGDWIVDMPGIIQGFSYNIPDDAPWQIHDTPAQKEATLAEMNRLGLDEKRYDASALPHLIKVDGFKFTPIPKQIPRRISAMQMWYKQLDPAGEPTPLALSAINNVSIGPKQQQQVPANQINTQPYL